MKVELPINPTTEPEIRLTLTGKEARLIALTLQDAMRNMVKSASQSEGTSNEFEEAALLYRQAGEPAQLLFELREDHDPVTKELISGLLNL